MNLQNRNITRIIVLILGIILANSCDSDKLKETPIGRFEGVCELQGRTMLNGIKVKIEKNENNKLTGKIIELNDNKYV